jgi:hypothetical protein
MVTPSLTTLFEKRLFIIEWWAQVTVIPLDKRITVFNNGTEYVESGTIPKGGHVKPNSMVGDKDAS